MRRENRVFGGPGTCAAAWTTLAGLLAPLAMAACASGVPGASNADNHQVDAGTEAPPTSDASPTTDPVPLLDAAALPDAAPPADAMPLAVIDAAVADATAIDAPPAADATNADDAAPTPDAASSTDAALTADAHPPTGPVLGLTGTYFRQADLSDPAFTRVDASIKFLWGTDGPAPGLAVDGFSVRWTGFVQPDYTETYAFHTVSDDGVRLWVDGQLLIDHWTTHSVTEDTGTITLVAGEMYPVTLEYFEYTRHAEISLLWSSTSQTKRVIPEANLFTSAGSD